MEVNPHTKIYGVLGSPVLHSHSPRIFNRLFEKYGINGIYHYWQIPDQSKILKNFLKNIQHLNIKGLSVTIPFKKKILPFLDELDPLAQKLNCINTITFVDGKTIGYNYDGIAALKPLSEIPDWREKKILFLGLGGAAQGIILTLYFHFKYAKRVTIAARESKKIKKFNFQFQETIPEANSLKWDELNKKNLALFDIVINTTPLGMHPHSSSSPLREEVISEKHVIYDIVYNPLKTKLLKDAQRKKAQTIGGLKMFLGQASEQMHLWTSVKVNFKTMEAIYLQ